MSENLKKGDIIVQWDGHFWNVYKSLEEAKEKCIARIMKPDSLFTPSQDFQCFEFFEVVEKPDFIDVTYVKGKPGFWYNDDLNYRHCYGYKCIDHGNIFEGTEYYG